MVDAFVLNDTNETIPDMNTWESSNLKTGGRRERNMPKGLSYESYAKCIKSAKAKKMDTGPCESLRKAQVNPPSPASAQKAGKMKNPKPRSSKYPGSV